MTKRLARLAIVAAMFGLILSLAVAAIHAQPTAAAAKPPRCDDYGAIMALWGKSHEAWRTGKTAEPFACDPAPPVPCPVCPEKPPAPPGLTADTLAIARAAVTWRTVSNKRQAQLAELLKHILSTDAWRQGYYPGVESTGRLEMKLREPGDRDALGAEPPVFATYPQNRADWWLP